MTKYKLEGMPPRKTVADTIEAESPHHAAKIYEDTYGFPPDWVENPDTEEGQSYVAECYGCGLAILAGDRYEENLNSGEFKHYDCPPN